MSAEYSTLGDSGIAPTLDVRRHPPTRQLRLPSDLSFARYRVSRCIGVGGMGTVYEATHALLRKRVAIKVMHTSSDHDGTGSSRFLREAELVARIRHPNVVDITDVGIEQGAPFLVMEFLEGEDLAALLAREGRLSPQRAVDLLLPAVAGLAAAHRVGIVHRDVKPENVFLASEPLGDLVVKLVDFGVSKDLSTSQDDARSEASLGPVSRHTVAGTPHYMAPEQVRGCGTLDARTDQYALGVLLYECLTGVRPFEAESLLALAYRIDAGVCEPVRALCPELSEELAAIVTRAMAPRIEDRFPSTEAFGRALSRFASRELRDAYARDFTPERRSSVPPPRKVGAAFVPASRAGWICNSAPPCTARRARVSLNGAMPARPAARAGAFGAAAFALVAAVFLWRAVDGVRSSGSRQPPIAAVQASSLRRELPSALASGLDLGGICRSIRAR